MTRKFALIPASLILAALANTLGATQIAVADAEYIKLIMLNKAKVDIEVFVQDFVGKKSDEQKNAVPTGKDAASKRCGTQRAMSTSSLRFATWTKKRARSIAVWRLKPKSRQKTN